MVLIEERGQSISGSLLAIIRLENTSLPSSTSSMEWFDEPPHLFFFYDALWFHITNVVSLSLEAWNNELEVNYDSADKFAAATCSVFDYTGSGFVDGHGICRIYLCPQSHLIPMAGSGHSQTAAGRAPSRYAH
jgi:hypothetical protein